MDEDVESLLEVLCGLLQRTHCEVRALRELLVDRKLISEGQLNSRIENIRREEFSDMKAQAKRRAIEKTLTTQKTQ